MRVEREHKNALEQAAAALRANGQDEAARLILQDPQPGIMPRPAVPGLPQKDLNEKIVPMVLMPQYGTERK